MRSSLTNMEIGELLDNAQDAFPDSDFVASVREWFEDHEFITEAQEEALQRIADGD